MKKIFILSLLLFSLILSASAQSLTNIFLNIPDDIAFGLAAEDKDQLIAATMDTSDVVIENVFEGETKRLALSDDYIALQTSEAGTVQIKLLPLINDSKIICVIKTVCGKACDSQMSFYTTNWTPVPQSELMPVKDISWFLKSDSDKNSDDYKYAILAATSMFPVKLNLAPDSLTLTAVYEPEKYLSEEDSKKLKPFLTNQPKNFNWNKTAFR